MASGRFKVVLTGQTDRGRDVADVRTALMQLFKLSEEEVARLLESAPVTVKRGLDYDTAAKYKAAIEQTGARCDLREEEDVSVSAPAASTAPEGSAGPEASASPAQPTAAAMLAPAGAADAGPRPSASADATTTHAPTRVAAGRGAGWWRDGWRLFTAAPLPWILMSVVAFLVVVVVFMVPVLGIVGYFVLPPLLMGGMMFAAQVQHDGGTPRVGHLFEGFSRATAPLLGVAGLYLLLSIVIGGVTVMLLFAMGVGGAMMEGVQMGEPGAMDPLAGAALSGGVAVVVLVAIGLSVLVYAAVWFAAPLVMLGGLGATAAMKQSFVGCLANILPFLVYGLVLWVLAFLSVFTFGLAWLVLGPVLVLTVYASYREIFVD